MADFHAGGQLAVLMQPSRGREPEAEPLTARKVAGRSCRFRVVDKVAGACAPAHAERASISYPADNSVSDHGWRRMEADANPSTDGGVLASGPSYEIGFGLVGWNDPCLAGDKVTGPEAAVFSFSLRYVRRTGHERAFPAAARKLS